MRRTNVQGMQTILSLCAEGCPKLLHLVSTLSVITSGPIEAGKVIESPLSTLSFDRNGVFHGGYAASKFVAETLVDRCIQRGLNASVYRPGLLWCDSETHKSAPDWLSAMLIAIRHLGQYPQEIFQQGAFETDLTPVDYAADIISDSISSNKRHPVRL
jgi:thioester reductase-like protein